LSYINLFIFYYIVGHQVKIDINYLQIILYNFHAMDYIFNKFFANQ